MQEASKIDNDHNHLRLHYLTVVLLYASASLISVRILALPEAQTNLVSLLSSGAILATFGSAIGSIGLIWQSDLLERIRLNIDIFFKDIVKQEKPWRRWPFLSRSGERKLLNGHSHRMTLSNPKILLDVGSHIIEIDLPTVLEDFYDLPLIRNFYQLCRFRNSAHTVFSRRPKDEKNPETGLDRGDEYMAYECIFDIWHAIFKFRFARYIIHFGSGLTISGAITAGIYSLA